MPYCFVDALLQEVFIIGRSFVQEEDEFGTLAR